MTTSEFQRLRAIQHSSRLTTIHSSRRAQSKRTVRNRGKGVGRADMKHGKIISEVALETVFRPIA